MPPYEKITYSHQTFVKKKAVDSGESVFKRKIRIKESKSKSAEKVIVSESSKGISNTAIVNVSPTMMRFSRKTSLEKDHKEVSFSSGKHPSSLRQLSKSERREKEIGEHQEKLRRLHEERPSLEREGAFFSSSEPTFLGSSDVFPVEIIGSKISTSSYEDGLEQFKKMVAILVKLESRLEISSLKIVSFPGNRSFSFKEDGTPRRYALVEIQFDGKSYYLLEVERLTKIYLATLIINARATQSFEEAKLNYVVQGLLNGLIQNRGNWKVRSIENHDEAMIYRVKHLDEWTSYVWAEIVLERLNLPSLF